MYFASSLALACLEVLVHVRDPRTFPIDYVYTSLEIPDKSIIKWNPRLERRDAVLESVVLSRSVGTAFLEVMRNFVMHGVTSVSIQRVPLFQPRKTWKAFGTLDLSPESWKKAIADTVAIQVPSVVIPDEDNYIVCPESVSFSSLKWPEPKHFPFDPRLLDASLR